MVDTFNIFYNSKIWPRHIHCYSKLPLKWSGKDRGNGNRNNNGIISDPAGLVKTEFHVEVAVFKTWQHIIVFYFSLISLVMIIIRADIIIC